LSAKFDRSNPAEYSQTADARRSSFARVLEYFLSYLENNNATRRCNSAINRRR
jgi:hypothetical protein